MLFINLQWMKEGRVSDTVSQLEYVVIIRKKDSENLLIGVLFNQ